MLQSTKELLECLKDTTYALEQSLTDRKDGVLTVGLIADFERAMVVIDKYTTVNT